MVPEMPLSTGRGCDPHTTHKPFRIGVDLFVTLQVTSRSESLTAHITHKGFVTHVDQHVPLQATSPRKILTAHTASEGFLTRIGVDQLVLLQIASGGESFSTDIAHKGPVTGMDQHVSVQATTPDKSLAAYPTSKGFITGMEPLVHVQITSPGESLAAHVTSKGFITSMGLLVCIQITNPGESLTAHIANKGFMTTVVPLVHIQFTHPGVTLTTNITHMLSGFVCIPFTFPVSMVTKATARSGGVWTHSLQFLTMGRSHVCLQTAEVDENSRAVLTRMRSVQGRGCSRDDSRRCHRWPLNDCLVRGGFTSYRVLLCHMGCFDMFLKQQYRPALYGRSIINMY